MVLVCDFWFLYILYSEVRILSLYFGYYSCNPSVYSGILSLSFVFLLSFLLPCYHASPVCRGHCCFFCSVIQPNHWCIAMSFVIYISNCTLAVVVFLWMFPVTFSVFVFNFEEFISLLEPKSSLHVVFVLQTRLSKVLTQASAVHRDVDTNRLWRSSVNSAGSWQWFHFLLPALHLSPNPPLRGALSLCALCVRGNDEYRQKFMYNLWLLQKKLQFSWLNTFSMWEKYLHFLWA